MLLGTLHWWHTEDYEAPVSVTQGKKCHDPWATSATAHTFICQPGSMILLYQRHKYANAITSSKNIQDPEHQVIHKNKYLLY